MPVHLSHNPDAAQRYRLESFDASACVDIHCHCLPGLDDGPADIDDAIGLCRALVADGVTEVIATPHQLGKYDVSNTGAIIRNAVSRLQQAIDASQIPLRIHPGGDVRLDERLVELIEEGTVLTLADGPCLLLELPHEIWIDPTPLIKVLDHRGISVIVSHPERHPAIQSDPSVVYPWLDIGGNLQITAGSLCGDFGGAASQTAWALISRGAASIVAGDAHNTTSRPPRMSRAIDLLIREAGHTITKTLCIDNPAQVLHAARG